MRKGVQPCVYILASGKNGFLYTGVTSNLLKRVWQHKRDFVDGYSKLHKVHLLVYLEFHSSMKAAILREKQIKRWKRKWKIRLIKINNPDWRDLFKNIVR